MARAFQTLAELYSAEFDDIIDVRSPSEFAEDHIPGAISLPAMSDEERALIGTIFTQVSPFKARKQGAAIVSRNAATHLEGPLANKPGAWKPLVYCWRGGQRSGSIALILSQIGWRAETVQGGYQSYRRMVVELLHTNALPHRLILLDGNTGTAKTELLHLLARQKVQVLDLEGMANHRGSLLGSMSNPQPSQKAFESRLAKALTKLDPVVPTLVEAESSKIGEILIPPSLWQAMCKSPRIHIEAELGARARYLTKAYSDLLMETAKLSSVLSQLSHFHGHDKVGRWQNMAVQGDFEMLAAELMRDHYDPRYAKSHAKRTFEILGTVQMTNLDEAELTKAAADIQRIMVTELG